MAVKVECDGKNCDEDIFRSTGYQLIEGEVLIHDTHEIVEQEEYHGVFCSTDCLIQGIEGDAE